MAIVWNPLAGSAPRAPEGSITSALQQISNTGSALAEAPVREAEQNLLSSQLASADQARALEKAAADKVISDRETLLRNESLTNTFLDKRFNPEFRVRSDSIQAALAKTPEFRNMTPEQRLEVSQGYAKSLPAGTNIADLLAASNDVRAHLNTLNMTNAERDAEFERVIRLKFPTASLDEVKILSRGINASGGGGTGSGSRGGKLGVDSAQGLIDYMLNNFSGDNELFRSDYIGNKFNKGDYAQVIANLQNNNVRDMTTIRNVLSGAVNPNGIGNVDFTTKEGFEEILARARLDPNHSNQNQVGDQRSLEEVLAARMGILNLTKPTSKSDADIVKDILAFYKGSSGGGVPAPNQLSAILRGTAVPRTPEQSVQPTLEQVVASSKTPPKEDAGTAGVIKAVKESTGFSDQYLQNLLKSPPNLEGAAKAIDKGERSLLRLLQGVQNTVKHPGKTLKDLLAPPVVPIEIPPELQGKVIRGSE